MTFVSINNTIILVRIYKTLSNQAKKISEIYVKVPNSKCVKDQSPCEFYVFLGSVKSTVSVVVFATFC